MVGSAAIKQGWSANRKHTYFFWPYLIVVHSSKYRIAVLDMQNFHAILPGNFIII